MRKYKKIQDNNFERDSENLLKKTKQNKTKTGK